MDCGGRSGIKRKSAPELESGRNGYQRTKGTVSLPNRSQKGKPAAMSAHDFEHERARMRERRRMNAVNCFANSVQRRRGTDGHVRQRHVVVDRANESDDLQVAVVLGLIRGNATLVAQRRDERRPFCTENVRAGERSVTAADYERVDALFDEVVRGLQATFRRAEDCRACSADEGTTLCCIRQTLSFGSRWRPRRDVSNKRRGYWTSIFACRSYYFALE
jgi:hypothetical protein